jgi:hypothetical protein
MVAIIPSKTNGEDTKTTYSTLATKVWANFYDNIWIQPRFTGGQNGEWTGKSGINPIHEQFYGGDHRITRKKLSDHVPVWAEFYTNLPDDD